MWRGIQLPSGGFQGDVRIMLVAPSYLASSCGLSTFDLALTAFFPFYFSPLIDFHT
jgi:hypothetical protein